MYTIIRHGESSLEKIGRNVTLPIDKESRVKKVKRFLDCKYVDHKTFFLPYIIHLINALSHIPLVFVIDGSEVGNGCTVLMISLYYKKRGIPICWVVKECKKGHLPLNLHLDVINSLSEIIRGIDQKIIFLGDGEFDHAEIQLLCASNGWQYVLRTAKSNKFYNAQGESFKLKDLTPDKNLTTFLLPDVEFTENRYGPIQALIWHSPKHKSPIYLVSNMDCALDITTYYKRRFSIETIFGDIKSRGFHIHKTRIAKADRLTNMLIFVCLAFLICILFETYHTEYQSCLALFLRKNRTDQYSLFQIGLRALRWFSGKEMYNELLNEFCKDPFKYFCVR
ncbi:transposase [Persicobacter sp. CCB-QB2]|uniref:transposase n=1 Tax=Persicobacter sp. CCB-QB2 TaxID=1561025 RepID=UPI0006A9AC69|nr:transposase [Persicobacter sp. CCB-QB2]